MKLNSTSQSAFFNPRVIIAFLFCTVGVLLALLGFGVSSGTPALAAGQQHSGPVATVGYSYHHDLSPALRDLPQGFADVKQRHEGPENPKIPNRHKDMPDTVVQDSHASWLAKLAPSIPAPILNFDGIAFPGVNCNCAPPDTNGSVGTTQYVQIVNTGYEVFDKATGASVLGPNSIESIWSGFGGLCQSSGFGDPVVVFDKIARRWVVTQFAGGSVPTDECIAVSTSDDATGTYNRYGFHLSNNFVDYPKIAVWPDAYYLSINLFSSSTFAYLGPQPFAFDRAAMIAGQPLTTFVSFPALGPNVAPMLPADQDGLRLPPPGSPNPYLGWPQSGTYTLYHFHVDFVNIGNSTFTTFANPPAAPFTQPCPNTRACVPELGVSSFDWLDSLGDRLMHRLAYRNFRDHEALVGNYTVLANGTTAPRWFELRGVTAGPVTVFQESTYQPDTDWRWMGSVAMDKRGNLAIGFSASSSTIHPQIRYAGRLRRDPINTLAQGEAHLFDGAGSQTDTVNRWGDYSNMAIDPVDDRTFWFTSEYYSANTSFNWKTRIGNFKFVRPGQSDED
jgi:hypothetical protein